MAPSSGEVTWPVSAAESRACAWSGWSRTGARTAARNTIGTHSQSGERIGTSTGFARRAHSRHGLGERQRFNTEQRSNGGRAERTQQIPTRRTPTRGGGPPTTSAVGERPFSVAPLFVPRVRRERSGGRRSRPVADAVESPPFVLPVFVGPGA